MNNKIKSELENNRGKFDLVYLFVWVIGIPFLSFGVAVILLIPIDGNSISPLQFLLVIIFIGSGFIWNFWLGTDKFKILIMYLKHQESPEDVKSAKELKPVFYIFILILLILIQFILQILL